jgi:ATP-binding protein involved in chromosome partitioning
LPLALSIRESSDAGKPIVVAAPDSAEGELYKNCAKNLLTALEAQVKPAAPTVQFSDE